MTKDIAVRYEDDFGFTRPGEVFYPEALRRIAPVLAELNSEAILRPRYFNANLELHLDLIMALFRSLHGTHDAAKAVHRAYREHSQQYWVYLRSFVLGGMVLSVDRQQSTQQIGWTQTDKAFRAFLKKAASPVEGLSFINTFDSYPSDSESDDEAVEHMQRVTLPSFRLLSHDWQEVVRHVLRGAKFIVVNVEGETEGVMHELDLVRECDLARRTIVLRRTRGVAQFASDGFHAVVDVDTTDLEALNPAAKTLRALASELANDAYRQTNWVADLSDLPCWVVDRQIDRAPDYGAQAVPEGVPYDQYIPSSLATNWAFLTERFPRMVEGWKAIEAAAKTGSMPSTEHLVDSLQVALQTFYIAVTVERYYEMAMSLSTLGMAHRWVTQTVEIMTQCYRHATQCAEWHGDSELATFLRDAHANLERERRAGEGT